MPNLNVTLSQPHVEDRMKKVLMVEETMDTHQTIISFFNGIQNDSPLACILFAYYFAYRLQHQSDTRTVLLCCLHTNTD